MTATNDEIVRLANRGWELGRIRQGGPLDEATEKSVAEFKLAISLLCKGAGSYDGWPKLVRYAFICRFFQ